LAQFHSGLHRSALFTLTSLRSLNLEPTTVKYVSGTGTLMDAQVHEASSLLVWISAFLNIDDFIL
jgi:hypothetical protein